MMMDNLRMEVDRLKNGLVNDEFDVEALDSLVDRVVKFKELFGGVDQLEADLETLIYVYGSSRQLGIG